MMIKDVASAYRTTPQWEVYQKGLEALASSLTSINSQLGGSSMKALTIGDLLVKVKVPLILWALADLDPADSESVQVSTAICRAPEADTSL